MIRLDAVVTGDDSAAWSHAGFEVRGDDVVVGTTAIACTGDGGGHDRWRLVADDVDIATSIDGIVTTVVTEAVTRGTPRHPNGVTGLDHIVLRSPDLDRTTQALEAHGVDCRRVRDFTVGGHRGQQRFFRLGEVILELAGTPEPTGDGPASIWGFAFVAPDLDATAAVLGDRCSPPKQAVQPGRRILTVRTRELGIGPTIAVMSPHVRS